MQTIYLVYLLGGLVLARLLYTLYFAFRTPLRAVPGPFWARFTRLWYFYRVSRGTFEVDNVALHKKYAAPGEDHARIVRLGPNMYSIATPEKIVYGTSSRMPKSDWYSSFKPVGLARPTQFAEQDNRAHAELRRKSQALYTMTSVVGYEGYADECAGIFLQRLREASGRQKPVNFAHWLQCYAFDVIGDITYSKRFGFLDAGQDINGFMQSIEEQLVYCSLTGIYPWIHPVLYRVMAWLPFGNGPSGRAWLLKFIGERIGERKAQREAWSKEGKGVDARPDMPLDFLERLMDMADDGTKNITHLQLIQTSLQNIAAGSDTTAVSLSSIMYQLLRSPASMAALRAEIDLLERSGEIDANHVSFKATQAMPYLQACIKEGLRLHAATGLPLWRVVPEGGAEIYGQHFPAGTEVGLNTWVAHYDRDVWGPDASEFRPERWLEAEKEDGQRIKEMDAFYMPFGLGARTCVGRHISQLEMSKLVPLLVRNFDFELDPRLLDSKWKTKNFWFVKQTDFVVKIKERKQEKH